MSLNNQLRNGGWVNRLGLGSFLLVAVIAAMLAPALFAETVTPLRDGWQLQSACKVSAAGDKVSRTAFSTTGWIPTKVPSTVLAAQVAAGIYPNPYFGDNLRKLPGMDYKVGEGFQDMPMSADSPYHCGWWYRDEFTGPVVPNQQYRWLRFHGINYRADIWLNGHEIANSTEIAGTNRRYDLNVTKFLKPGKRNVLAVEVWAPTPHDLAVTFVDWNPMPPDKDMGLWGKVNLVATGPISIQFPAVVTHFPNGNDLSLADLTVYARVRNATDRTVEGTVSGSAAGAHFEQSVSLAPHEDKAVEFSPDKFPELRIRNPKIWWPRQMGQPNLEPLTINVSSGGRLSDQQKANFGIREITSTLNARQARVFRINGKRLLVRGGGWTEDMLLRPDQKRLREQFKLVRHLNLNTLRLEGQMAPAAFFREADKNGILVMAGWVCCSQWQHWASWTPETLIVAKASLRSQILRLRIHPSILVWLNGSDIPPVPSVERAYLQIEAETHWPNPILSSANNRPTTVTGLSGVKMSGPYNYVEPSYWWVAMRDKGSRRAGYGGAYGFNTETSPGPAIPGLASRKKFLPDPEAWPPSDVWALHYSGGGYTAMKILNDAMNAIYGQPSSLAQYVRVANTMEYASERAEFESYTGNKYNSTGVIQWMLNNAWPSMYWHLYDYYLEPSSGYYAVKKACQPLHIEYDYKNKSVLVVNSTYHAVSGLHATITVHGIGWNQLYHADALVHSPADSSQTVFKLPETLYSGTERIFLVNLELTGNSGKVVSRNFYWIPYRLAKFDWPRSDASGTASKGYPNLTALARLPKAVVTARAQLQNTNEGSRIHLELKNASGALAFQVRFVVRTPSGGLIAPVIWSDDWVELTPGESRTFTTATLPKDIPKNAEVVVTGWNIPRVTIAPTPASSATASE